MKEKPYNYQLDVEVISRIDFGENSSPADNIIANYFEKLSNLKSRLENLIVKHNRMVDIRDEIVTISDVYLKNSLVDRGRFTNKELRILLNIGCETQIKTYKDSIDKIKKEIGELI